ncbi:DOMON-like domain-containing protein [Parasphingorhabdus sp.]|uniref:DOMON-like domain-containing protein n=1 Tax=Parasphingorhabdus sp. TaxID=2709688 RepID=UPI0035940B4C
MRLNLQCHPSTPVSAIDQIAVEWSMSETGTIWLRFHATGHVDEVILPDDLDQSERTDNLWQRTCFELFLKEPGKERYCEFNFAPSGNWAGYSFSSYREGMDQLAMAQAPEIFMDFSDAHIGLEASFGLPDNWVQNEFEAALSAVIEMQNGEKSLWALAHPAGRPDFHHQDCFKLEMKATER